MAELSKAEMPQESPVWGIVLAAGLSRRMGQPKLLLPLADGRSVLRHTLDRVCAAREVHRWIVALNPEIPEFREMDWPAVVEPVWVHNAADGQSVSLRTAVERAETRGAAAVVIVLGDQPKLASQTIDQVVQLHRTSGARVVRARYVDGPGHPVLLHASLFPEVMRITGDEGARRILRAHAENTEWVDVEQPAPVDIDTPENYQRFLTSAD